MADFRADAIASPVAGAVLSATITVPATAVVGDYAVMQFTYTTSATSVGTLPTLTVTGGSSTAWTIHSGPDLISAQIAGHLLGKTIEAADIGATVTLTLSAAQKMSATMAVYSGVTTTGLAFAKASEATADTTTTIPTIASVPAGAVFHIGLEHRVSSGTAPNVTVTAPYSQGPNSWHGTTAASGSNDSTEYAYQIVGTAGSKGGEALTVSAAGLSWNYALSIPEAAAIPPPTPPALLGRMVGIPTNDTAPVSVRTSNATAVRLVVGTDSAVSTGLIYGPSTAPDARGNAQLTVSGLAPGTSYFYRVEMTAADTTVTLDTGAVGKLKTAPVGPANFAFCAGSCDGAADSSTWAALAARGDDLFFHLGDWPYDPAATSYADGSGTGLQNFRDKFNDKIAAPNHALLLSTTPVGYTPSDHDGMSNNTTAGSDPTAWTNWNAAYREIIPSPALASSTGVYYTFTWGRVRFLVIDTRSAKSDPALADGPTKTALGTAQKQWLKDNITAATEPALVIVQADPWVGVSVDGSDTWDNYLTERTELANFFAASGKNIVMLAGDMHALAADDGTNAPGGITVFQAAPLHNTASRKGGPYTQGPYPATGSALVQQYGRVVVTDTGGQISLAFAGYSSDNTQRVALTKTFDLTTEPQTVTDRWDGTQLIRQRIDRWNGSALVQQTTTV